MKSITYHKAESGGYLVRFDGDRIGFTRCVDRVWYATDAFLVALRGKYATRDDAAKALHRRHTRSAKDADYGPEEQRAFVRKMLSEPL